jgi:hypothetical protein
MELTGSSALSYLFYEEGNGTISKRTNHTIVACKDNRNSREGVLRKLLLWSGCIATSGKKEFYSLKFPSIEELDRFVDMRKALQWDERNAILRGVVSLKIDSATLRNRDNYRDEKSPELIRFKGVKYETVGSYRRTRQSVVDLTFDQATGEISAKIGGKEKAELSEMTEKYCKWSEKSMMFTKIGFGAKKAANLDRIKDRKALPHSWSANTRVFFKPYNWNSRKNFEGSKAHFGIYLKFLIYPSAFIQK